jgi:hypothetical protein
MIPQFERQCRAQSKGAFIVRKLDEMLSSFRGGLEFKGKTCISYKRPGSLKNLICN